MTEYTTTQKQFMYQAKLHKIDKERIRAFESRDSIKYYKLTEELGIDPECKMLFNQGKLELELLK